MDQQRLRAIKLKTGILKRYVKELHSYEKEVETEVKRLKKMQEDEKDEYKLKYQEKVINETQMMIPQCQKRVEDAYKELKQLLLENESNDLLVETDEFKAAQEVLSQLPPLVQSC